MSKLTNSEDRLRASLQDTSGLGGAGFDLLLLARHMLDSAALPSNSTEDATRDSRSDKVMVFSGHVDGGDAASMVAQDSGHANSTAAIANEMREAAFGKIAAFTLQANETQVAPHILNAFLQLEKLPTEWVLGSGKVKDESAAVHSNGYAPQSTEIVQLHDWSAVIPAKQPISADHDDRSTIAASSASGNSVPAAHRFNSGDAGHNAASGDLTGSRPDLASINGGTRDLSAVSMFRTTETSDHVFQNPTSFYSENTASAQFSNSNYVSTDTDGTELRKLSVIPVSHGQNGSGLMSGSSFGTDATHQQTAVGGAQFVMADDFASPGIQSSVVSSDSTSMLIAHQVASAGAAILPSQEPGELATSSLALADAANSQNLPVGLPSPETHENELSNVSATSFIEASPTISPTEGHTGLSSSQAMVPSLDTASSGQTSVDAPVHEGSLGSGMSPDPAQTPDGQMEVPPAPSGVESVVGTPDSHPADAAHPPPPVSDSESPRPAIDSLSAHPATESASTPTDIVSIATPDDPGPDGTLPLDSGHGIPPTLDLKAMPLSSAVTSALESTVSDTGSVAPALQAAAAMSADQSPLSSSSQHIATGQDESGTHPADPRSSLTQPDAHVGPLADLINSLPQTHVLMQGPPIETTGFSHAEDVSYRGAADIAYTSPALNQQGSEVEALRAHFGYLLGANGFDNSLTAHPTDNLGSDPAHQVFHELALDHSTPPPLPGLADFHYDHLVLDPGLAPDVHVDLQLWHSH